MNGFQISFVEDLRGSFICKNHSENFSTESKFRDTLAYPFHSMDEELWPREGITCLKSHSQ